jgi:hypothetical protein
MLKRVLFIAIVLLIPFYGFSQSLIATLDDADWNGGWNCAISYSTWPLASLGNEYTSSASGCEASTYFWLGGLNHYLEFPNIASGGIYSIELNSKSISSTGSLKLQKNINGGGWVDVETKSITTTQADYTFSVNESSANTKIRFIVSSSHQIYLYTIKVYQLADMSYSSATVTQVTDDVMPGTENAEVVRLEVVTSGSENAINISSFSINTTGTTSSSDISNMRIYTTGTSSTFATTTQLGATQTPGSGTVNSGQNLPYTLSEGTNYFWITYDVNINSPLTNVIDAVCTSITVDGSAETPTETAPTGSREIKCESAQIVELLNEDFEGAHGWTLTNFEVGGAGSLNGNPTTNPSGSNILGTDLDGEYSDNLGDRAWTAISPEIDCSSTTGITLNFQRWLGVESSTYDHAYIDVWDGSDWQNVYTNGTTTLEESEWSNQEIDISTHADGVSDMKVRFSLGATDGSVHYCGWNIDDVIISGTQTIACSNMSLISTTTSQITDNVNKGTTDNPVIKIEVETTDRANPLEITSFTINTTGTTSLSDIENIKLWETGLSGTFVDAVQLGNTTATPTGSDITLSGLSHYLNEGTNYFWVTMDVKSGATTDNYIDAVCSSITIDASAETPDITAPSGSRRIVVPMVYTSSTTTQNQINYALAGNTDTEVIGIQVVTTNPGNPISATKFSVNSTGCTSVADIENAKIYYTGSSSQFDATNQFGSTFAAPTTANFDITGSQELVEGTNYFWLTYDVKAGATTDNVIDGQCTQVTVDGSDYAPTVTSPSGTRTIKGAMSGTYIIDGDLTTADRHYSDFSDLISDLELFGVEGAITVNVDEGTYNDQLDFNGGNITGYSQTNNISVQADASNTADVIIEYNPGGVGANAFVLSLDNITYFNLDGRPGASGTTQGITLRNTATGGSEGNVIRILNNSSNNTLKYLNIEGENTVTVASDGTNNGIISYGLIAFGESTTGNNNNTIDNCHISDLSTGGTSAIPHVGIVNDDEVGGHISSANTISNCHFIDVINTDNGENSSAILLFDTDEWTITNNHFYQTQSLAAGNNLNIDFITINSGDAYTVSSNYFGGSESDCGGTAFTIDFSGDLDIISFQPRTASVANTISGNTIANLDVATDGGDVDVLYYGIKTSLDFNNNTIGSLTSNGSIALDTYDGTSNYGIFKVVYNGDAVDYEINCSGNDIGGISTNGPFRLFEFQESASGFLVLSNSTIGGNVANSIQTTNGDYSSIIWSQSSNANGISVDNCTIQNINAANLNQNTTNNGFIINHYGTTSGQVGEISFTDNTVKSIDITLDIQTGSYSLIDAKTDNARGNATISGNTFEDIDVITSDRGFSFISISNGGYDTFAFARNTFGASSANDIVLNGNNKFSILFDGSGGSSSTISQNIVQNIELTNTGSSSKFIAYEIGNDDVTISQETINNITYSGSSTSYDALCGIYSWNGSGLSSISQTSITNLVSESTSADVKVSGMYLRSSTSISKCFIKGLENASNGSSSEIAGIYLTNSPSLTMSNSVIMISNGSNTHDLSIYGINDSRTGASSINLYHNTILIDGSTDGTSVCSGYTRSGNYTISLKNNVLGIGRTKTAKAGGNLYALYLNSTTSFSSNNNYYAVADDANKMVYDGSSDLSFASWAETGSVNDTDSFDAIGKPISDTWAGADMAEDITGTISDDKEGTVRDSDPWIGAYEKESTLPVELISFTGQISAGSAILHWVTQTEINSDYFEVQHSLDAKEYITIGYVLAQGNSNHQTEYSFIHENPVDALNYYRLIQYDFDGQTTYTEVLALEENNDFENCDIDIFPNPAVDYVIIENYTSFPVELKIFNSHAIIVMTEIVNSGKNMIGLEKFSPGIYMIVISSQDKMILEKKLVVF